MKSLTLTIDTARRFMRQATGLDTAFADLATALDHLGFVQIDPINVCGRMHDHILRHRVQGYGEGDLMRHLHRAGPRSAFEHHLPDSSNLAALPLDAWPHLQRAMQARAVSESTWSGKLTPAEKKLAARILARMADEGPLSSQDIESARKAKTHAWDSTTLAKSTLHKLFFHGRVLIARRDGIRRYYDLPGKVLPTATLNASTPSAAETARWLAELKLRQRRLAILKSSEARALSDEVVAVAIESLPKLKLHLLRRDLSQLEKAQNSLLGTSEPLLLAPLDPIIYDRRVTEHLWAFDYRWEVYVPPQKRQRGYYALPLLHGTRFTGHADLKADREVGELQILSSEGRSAKTAARSLASFLGLKSV
ncbi:MAG: YcaQ family DNA glycosylase [Verrucomicrobiaceae bacterium]|nr:YcaQ family DNA glycosylase [Verrucomicrobiaceae bacterium]